MLKIKPIRFALVWILGVICQQALAAESAKSMYQECEAKETLYEQRECFPLVARQSEFELKDAEKKERALMAEVQRESSGSHAVAEFDAAERAYRAFRDAERRRVLGSYGSGTGGGIESYRTMIEMDFNRMRLLESENCADDACNGHLQPTLSPAAHT